MMEKHVYEEYQKFLNKEVTVVYKKGDEVIEKTGELVFLSFQYLSCVIRTKEKDVIVKHIITIEKEREK